MPDNASAGLPRQKNGSAGRSAGAIPPALPEAVVEAFGDLLARAGRVLGLRIAFHDRLHRGLPEAWLQHGDPACRSVRRTRQNACAAFCGGEVHDALADRPAGRIHTCPFGHTEAVAPVIEDGIYGGVLYAGPCWTGPGAPPRAGLTRPPDAAWLPDRLLVLRATAREAAALLAGERRDAAPTRRSRILGAIRERMDGPVRLADAAGALHLSPSRAGRVVRELFGKTWSELVHEVKTREAARMLTTTDCTVAEAARRLGYSDQAHFTRVFRRRTGAPPGVYRRRRGPTV